MDDEKDKPTATILSLWYCYGTKIHSARTSGMRSHGWGEKNAAARLGCTTSQARRLLYYIDNYGAKPTYLMLQGQETEFVVTGSDFVVHADENARMVSVIQQTDQVISALRAQIVRLQKKVSSLHLSCLNIKRSVSAKDYKEVKSENK